jgi:hypothetical protein
MLVRVGRADRTTTKHRRGLGFYITANSDRRPEFLLAASVARNAGSSSG